MTLKLQSKDRQLKTLAENKAFEPSELDRTQSRVSKNASSTAYGLPLPFQDALQLRPVRTTTF